jgi:DNA-binding NarL/FixJ family response regulator
MEGNDMNNQDLALALRTIASGSSNMGLDAKFRNKENAKVLAEYALGSISKLTGVSMGDLLEDYLIVSQPVVKEEKQETLGYGTSFSLDVYEELDKLIREGLSNKVIASKLGIHRNTVTNRRNKIM